MEDEVGDVCEVSEFYEVGLESEAGKVCEVDDVGEVVEPSTTTSTSLVPPLIPSPKRSAMLNASLILFFSNFYWNYVLG